MNAYKTRWGPGAKPEETEGEEGLRAKFWRQNPGYARCHGCYRSQKV